jgi:hypothetical protein
VVELLDWFHDAAGRVPRRPENHHGTTRLGAQGVSVSVRPVAEP